MLQVAQPDMSIKIRRMFGLLLWHTICYFMVLTITIVAHCLVLRGINCYYYGNCLVHHGINYYYYATIWYSIGLIVTIRATV